MKINALEANTEWSRRVALPVAIAVHILLFMLLSRSTHKQVEQVDAQALTVQLLPFLQPEAPVAPAAAPPRARQGQQSVLPGQQKNRPVPGASVPKAASGIDVAPAIPESTLKVPDESADDGKPTFNDPSALVKSYGSEYGKSDLQKAIESHGGTVALTKGKYDDFHQQVDFATIPDCMRPDALKHDPPKIGPVNLNGLPVLIFLAHAAATGKCKLPGASN